MNKEQFLKIMLPTGEYYGKKITDGLINVYFNQVKEINCALFEALVKNHMADPEQGQFWPTFAHLIKQVGNESDIATQAGIDFDGDSTVDGSLSFDRQRETTIQTAQRRKRYIDSQKLEWKKLTPEQKFSCSNLLLNLNKTKLIGE